MLTYLKDVRSELRQVVWPSRKTTLLLTGVIIVVSALAAVYLGVWDFLFSRLLAKTF